MGLEMHLIGLVAPAESTDPVGEFDKEECGRMRLAKILRTMMVPGTGYHVQAKPSEKYNELGNWEKHADLHDFIVKAFGHAEEGRPIPLDAQQIHRIIDAIENDALPRSNSFLGQSLRPGAVGYAQQKAEDLEVLAKALEWLFRLDPAGGQKAVVYEASW